MVTKKIYLKSPDEVIRLLGQQDEKLRRLESKYGVQIFVRQGGSTGDFSVVVRGSGSKVDKTIGEIERARNEGFEAKEPESAGQEKAAGRFGLCYLSGKTHKAAIRDTEKIYRGLLQS